MAISKTLEKKVNKIYAYMEASQVLETILSGLWAAYVIEQNITKKKKLSADIERFEKIQNKLNDNYQTTV